MASLITFIILLEIKKGQARLTNLFESLADLPLT